MRNSNWMMRAVVFAAVAVALVSAPARAQTPEGTVITNKAKVTYQDANGRAYAPDSASAVITVGFKAGLNVTTSAGTATPASPSTGQSITFTVANIGNGLDSVQVTESNGNPAVIEVTGYQINGAGSYNNLGALNAALLIGHQLAGITGSLTIQVLFNVNPGQGGQTTAYTLTATSRRDGTMNADAVKHVSPPTSYGVAVTPHGNVHRQQLPSGASTYTETFTVQNTGNADATFDLLASSPGAVVIGIVTVNAVSGDSTHVAVATGASVSIGVAYTVAEVAVGTKDTLFLKATVVASPATVDSGFADLEVIRPRVAITKQAYRSGGTTLITGSDNVVPTEVVWFKVSVSNAGNQDAKTVAVVDTLPTELTFVDVADDGSAGWTLTHTGNVVNASLAGNLAASASRYFWIKARVN